MGDKHDSNMPQHQSYPSPTAAQMGYGGPYAQQQLQAPDDMELSAQLSREMGNNATRNVGDEQHMHQMPQSMPTPRQMQMGDPQQGYGQHMHPAQHTDPSLGGDGPGSKKNKVSRACDECRRKKIKCDAEPDAGDGSKCSNCRRTGATCQFSRVPMKRGPSKGYIKELADRVQTLEQSVGTPIISQGHDSPGLQPDYPSPMAGMESDSRKRNHSMSEGMVYPSGFGDHDPPAGRSSQAYYNMAPAQANFVDFPHSGPAHKALKTRNGATATSHQDTNDVVSQPGQPFEWENIAVTEYYRTIHPTFPLLAHSKTRLHNYIGNVSKTLRDAFLGALYTAVRYAPGNAFTNVGHVVALDATYNALMSYQLEVLNTQNALSNIVYMQGLALLLIGIDMSGPANSLTYTTSMKGSLLGSIVGMANSMNLHSLGSHQADEDVDSFSNVSRRLWISLVVLDRWYAASTSKPLSIPDSSSNLESSDKGAIGMPLLYLARISLVLGHLSEIFVSRSPASDLNSTFISRLMAGEIDTLRQLLDTSNIASMPTVNLCFQHVKLLQQRHTPSASSEVAEILESAQNIVGMLSNSHPTIPPLQHHVVTLAVLTLTELLDTKGQREAAMKELHQLRAAIANRQVPLLSFAADQEGATSWATALVDHINRKLQQSESTIDRGGLQHLADLAVGESEGKDAEKGNQDGNEETADQMDWSALTKVGYLTVLS